MRTAASLLFTVLLVTCGGAKSPPPQPTTSATRPSNEHDPADARAFCERLANDWFVALSKGELEYPLGVSRLPFYLNGKPSITDAEQLRSVLEAIAKTYSNATSPKATAALTSATDDVCPIDKQGAHRVALEIPEPPRTVTVCIRVDHEVPVKVVGFAGELPVPAPSTPPTAP